MGAGRSVFGGEGELGSVNNNLSQGIPTCYTKGESMDEYIVQKRKPDGTLKQVSLRDAIVDLIKSGRLKLKTKDHQGNLTGRVYAPFYPPDWDKRKDDLDK